MFARFKNFLEPIERPYCYLLLVTCYLLPLGVANLGDRTCGTTLLLLVNIGGGEFGRQNMCSDLIVSC